MTFLFAFLIGGCICMIGQLVYDIFKLSLGHITAILVVSGVLLDSFNFYDKLIEISGAGALIPITSFGHTMIHSALEGYQEVGIFGFFEGILGSVSFGISIVIILSFINALIFKPKH
ncbi:MAG: SpoVA/SpoVAEb family sporulation membrane protein [bacterium]